LLRKGIRRRIEIGKKKGMEKLAKGRRL